MMNTAEMLEIFNKQRGDAIVIPGRGGRFWVEMSDQPDRDLPLGDPAMGGHASFALGLALAIPDQRVVLFDSEGDVLMGMGALPTIADKAPTNLYHFMLDNGVYATTGGQPVPNAEAIEYDVVAQGCGYPATYSIDNLEDQWYLRKPDRGNPEPTRTGVRGSENRSGNHQRAHQQPPAVATQKPQSGSSRHAGRAGDRGLIYCAATRDEYLIPCDTLKFNLPSEDNMTSDLAATEIEFESEGIAPVQPVLGSTGVWHDLLGRFP